MRKITPEKENWDNILISGTSQKRGIYCVQDRTSSWLCQNNASLKAFVRFINKVYIWISFFDEFQISFPLFTSFLCLSFSSRQLCVKYGSVFVRQSHEVFLRQTGWRRGSRLRIWHQVQGREIFAAWGLRTHTYKRFQKLETPRSAYLCPICIASEFRPFWHWFDFPIWLEVSWWGWAYGRLYH